MVTVDRTASAWTVTLDRPERLNALGEQVRDELHDVVRRLADEPSVPVVVLRGEGRAFSAGADLKEMAPSGGSWVERRHRSGAWQRLLDDLEALPQVSVAALHGPVIGGAVLLAAACDLRVAADDTVLSIPEVALGIPLTWAGLPRLVREIGLPATRDLVLTGRRVDAAEAHRLGLVQRVVAASALDGEVAALVEALAAQPPGPLTMTRQALAAIGRDRGGFAASWSDPDLLGWSLTDDESRAAARRYLDRLAGDES